jgi:hypothetical protein
MKKIALLGLAWTTALVAPGLASADTQSFSTPTVSANPTAGSPVSFTETGASDSGSTMTVSAQAGGGPCTAAAKPIDSVAVSGSFSHVTTFTPTTPGPYTICYAFSGPNGSQSESFSIVVAPAPPPPSPPATPAPAPAPSKCVTPKLVRHSLAYAEHLLTLGDCKLGRVYEPSARTLSAAKRKNGGHAPKLVVVSQTPRLPGTVLPAGNVVAVRLGLPAPPKPAARKTA